jgi:hypothetical protein
MDADRLEMNADDDEPTTLDDGISTEPGTAQSDAALANRLQLVDWTEPPAREETNQEEAEYQTQPSAPYVSPYVQEESIQERMDAALNPEPDVAASVGLDSTMLRGVAAEAGLGELDDDDVRLFVEHMSANGLTGIDDARVFARYAKGHSDHRIEKQAEEERLYALEQRLEQTSAALPSNPSNERLARIEHLLSQQQEQQQFQAQFNAQYDQAIASHLAAWDSLITQASLRNLPLPDPERYAMVYDKFGLFNLDPTRAAELAWRLLQDGDGDPLGPRPNRRNQVVLRPGTPPSMTIPTGSTSPSTPTNLEDALKW